MISLIFAWNSHSQDQIHGRVYDAYTNTPIEGVTLLYGNNQGTVTDKDGIFTIPCNQQSSLKITHVSYETWEGKITSCSSDLQIGLIPSILNLNAVEVSASTGSSTIMLEEPQAISMLSRRDLKRSSGIYLEETINLEPGIRMEKRTNSGGQRITIRGYGNDTNFNGTGYKAYINGVPITDASGATILDDVDFSTLGKVEVIKGPESSLYGAGIAGVVNMYTMKPNPHQTTLNQDFTAGSYGLLRSDSRLETATDKSSILLNYGLQNYDSDRIHSGSEKDYASFIGDFRPNDKQVFSTYISYNNSYEQLAGQLDSTSFVNRENVAEQKYLDNDGHVDIESIRGGFSHRYQFSRYLTNVTSGFFSSNNLNQTFAVGLNDNYSQNFGGRTTFNLTFGNENVTVLGSIGGELQKTSGAYKSYSMFGGVQGGATSDNDVSAIQSNLFTQWDFLLPSDFKVTVGASANFLKYDITDLLANSSNPSHKDGSGVKKFDTFIAPRIALQKTFNSNISVYTSISQGYTPPTTSNVIIPYIGEVNTNLNPETGTQYEIGTKGNLLEDKLSWQIALFSLNIKDKLTSQAVADGSGTVLYTYSVNAGDQTNNGLELAVSYTAINDIDQTISYLRPFVTFTYNDFTYNTFKSDNNNNSQTRDYSGNEVIGVPPVLFNAGLDIGTNFGAYLNTSFKYVDDTYITFDNNHSAPSYSLLSSKIGYKKNLGNHFNIDVFAGGNNLTNSLYYNMVFVNWERGAQPSIYSPGARKPTFFGGINIKYSL